MGTVKRVSPQEAQALVDSGWIYVDVRSEPEFAAGHPTGAHNVPLAHSGPRGMQPNPDFLAVMEGVYAKDAQLVVGCQAGGRSLRAAEMLAAAGFTAIVDQRRASAARATPSVRSRSRAGPPRASPSRPISPRATRS